MYTEHYAGDHLHDLPAGWVSGLGIHRWVFRSVQWLGASPAGARGARPLLQPRCSRDVPPPCLETTLQACPPHGPLRSPLHRGGARPAAGAAAEPARGGPCGGGSACGACHPSPCLCPVRLWRQGGCRALRARDGKGVEGQQLQLKAGKRQPDCSPSSPTAKTFMNRSGVGTWRRGNQSGLGGTHLQLM